MPLARGKGNKGKQRAEPQDSHSGESSSGEESDDAGRVKVKFENVSPEYLNQPINAEQGAHKVKGIVNELQNVKNHLKEAIEAVGLAASDAAESEAKGGAGGEEEEEEEELVDPDNLPKDSDTIASLDAQLRQLIDKRAEVQIRMEVLSELRQRIVREPGMSDLYKKYEDAVSGPLALYQQKTSRQKFLEDEAYVNFRTTIFEVLYDGQPVPNIKKMIPAEEGDDEDDDDDIEIGAQQSDFKCPLTLTILKDPKSSKKCKHSFSGMAIDDLLKQGHGQCKCPISGCPATLTSADMFKDNALNKRVENFTRRQKETQERERQQRGTQYQTLEDSDDE